MRECEKCGVQTKGLKRVTTDMHFGKPIKRSLCRKCAREVKEENKKGV